jgi:hypothetical protein
VEKRHEQTRRNLSACFARGRGRFLCQQCLGIVLTEASLPVGTSVKAASENRSDPLLDTRQTGQLTSQLPKKSLGTVLFRWNALKPKF